MSPDFRKFTIRHLLTLTAVVAVGMGVIRLFGPTASRALLLAAYGFAPTIAMMVICLARQHSTRVKWMLGASTLALLALAMLLHSGLNYGRDALYFVALGTVIEWPGQIAVLTLLYRLRQKHAVELPSPHVDRWHASDMPESFISVLELEPVAHQVERSRLT